MIEVHVKLSNDTNAVHNILPKDAENYVTDCFNSGCDISTTDYIIAKWFDVLDKNHKVIWFDPKGRKCKDYKQAAKNWATTDAHYEIMRKQFK